MLPVGARLMDRQTRVRSILLALAALLCVAALAQVADDDPIQDYVHAWDFFGQLVRTILCSGIYLLIFPAIIGVTCSYLRRFEGVDGDFLIWSGLAWLGGMFINIGAYTAIERFWALTPERGTHFNLIAALVTVPLNFGLGLLLATRGFADLTIRDAWRVALITALLCAPYFVPTWHFRKPPTPPTESRLEVGMSFAGFEPATCLVPEGPSINSPALQRRDRCPI
jgi:MFS family permease